MSVFETLQVREDLRIIASYENLSTIQDVCGEDLGVVWWRSQHDYASLLPWSKEPVKGLKDFIAGRDLRYADLDKVVRIYVKWLAVYHNKFVEPVELQGYSQSDWAHAYIISNEPIVEADRYDAQAWWRGDYYRITVEQSKVFTAEDGETATLWREVEGASAYGMLLPDGLTQDFADLYLKGLDI